MKKRRNFERIFQKISRHFTKRFEKTDFYQFFEKLSKSCRQISKNPKKRYWKSTPLGGLKAFVPGSKIPGMDFDSAIILTSIKKCISSKIM